MIKRVDEQVFQLLSCPRGPAEELEARFDRRFVSEAANINPLGQAVPPVEILQAKHDLLKRHAVERVVDLFFSHVVRIAYSFGSLRIIASNLPQELASNCALPPRRQRVIIHRIDFMMISLAFYDAKSCCPYFRSPSHLCERE